MEVQFSHSGSKFWNFWKKTQAWFQRESAWKTRDFTVKVREKLVILESPKNYKSSFFHSWIYSVAGGSHTLHYHWPGGPWTCKSLSGKHEKGHWSQSWSQWFWWVRAEGHIWYIGFILLDSPLYQYKGSCFREVCADEGVVGGNLRGFYWGIHTRLFNIIHVYMLNSYHFLSFFRVKWKGYF